MVYALIAGQMLAWAWFASKGGEMSDVEFYIFTFGMIAGQVGATYETFKLKAWGTMAVQLWFFAFTAWAGLVRYFGDTAELIGYVSGGIVFLSVLPYLWRVWQKKITPNMVSWTVWTILGLAFLLNYKAGGAQDNIWPAVFSFVNPLAVTILLFWKGKKKWPDRLELLCGALGIASIVMWWFMKENIEMVAVALGIALLADSFAAIPTVRAAWKEPWLDRPFAWACYAAGYGLSLFVLPNWELVSWMLPVFMATVPFNVAFPLAWYRWRNGFPLKEWI